MDLKLFEDKAIENVSLAIVNVHLNNHDANNVFLIRSVIFKTRYLFIKGKYFKNIA